MAKKQIKKIDLHGLTTKDAMETFIVFYNKCVKEGYKDYIEVIHGYGFSGEGSGDIRKELLKFLHENKNKIFNIIEGDKIGNPGITKVYPKELLLGCVRKDTKKRELKIKW